MWFFLCYSVSGTGISSTACCADSRISLAPTVTGRGAVGRAIKVVRGEFRAEVNHRPARDAGLWDIFENGTHEQRAAEQDRFWEDVFEKDAADRRRSPL